jgi:endoribonuclease Dicer
MLDFLKQGKLSLSQIHTLVISEEERIKTSDSDPVARIMTDYYTVTDDLSKPRILLMITSPDVDVGLYLSKFEQLFDMHLFTSNHLQHALDGVQEEIFILDPTTSCRLYSHHAHEVIGRVAAELAKSDQTWHDQPIFEYEQSQDGSAICTLTFPSGAPFQRISGFEYHSRTDAKRSACYQTCRKLFDQGLLDHHHFPLNDSDLRSTLTNKSASSGGEPTLTNLDENVKRNGVQSYPRRSPVFWTNSFMVSDQLYPTVILPQQGSDLTPIVLLTRLPLPHMPSFDLFFSGAPIHICFQNGCPFSLDHDKIRDLRRYTLRLHRIIGNKPFVCDQKSMPYFLAPLSPSWADTSNQHRKSSWALPDVLSHIPWNAVILAASKAFVHMKTDSTQCIEAEFNDSVVQDRWVEYTRRYFTLKVRHDLSPLHKPSEEEVCCCSSQFSRLSFDRPF